MNSNSLITIQDDIIGAKVDDIVKFADIKKESVLALMRNTPNVVKFKKLLIKDFFKYEKIAKDENGILIYHEDSLIRLLDSVGIKRKDGFSDMHPTFEFGDK